MHRALKKPLTHTTGAKQLLATLRITALSNSISKETEEYPWIFLDRSHRLRIVASTLWSQTDHASALPHSKSTGSPFGSHGPKAPSCPSRRRIPTAVKLQAATQETNEEEVAAPTVTVRAETLQGAAPLQSCRTELHFCPGTRRLLRHLCFFQKKATPIYTSCMLTTQAG